MNGEYRNVISSGLSTMNRQYQCHQKWVTDDEWTVSECDQQWLTDDEWRVSECDQQWVTDDEWTISECL